MDDKSPVYQELNKAWKATCKVLFGEEIGELKEYEEWLKENMPPIGRRKSHVSGKDVILSVDDYDPNAKFVSIEEIKEKTIEPLTINEIKDIDSIMEAVSEKWEYCGNVVLGNSKFVEGSTNVINSTHVADSIFVSDSQYVFGSAAIKENSKYIFGSAGLENCDFVIRIMGAFGLHRAFETSISVNCADAFFNFNCENCQNIMFSFNQKNKSYTIGNLQLSKDKFSVLKSKLINEIKEELKRNKKFPSLPQLPIYSKRSNIGETALAKEKGGGNLKVVEKAFASTFNVLFKKRPAGLSQYENWLFRRLTPPKIVISPFSNRITLNQDRYFRVWVRAVPEDRFVNQEEGETLSKISLIEDEIKDLNRLKDSLGRIAYFVGEMRLGKNYNITDCAYSLNSTNIFRTSVAISSEYAAMCETADFNTKYTFGSHRIVDSQFCIHCYYSSNLTRCFELDSCSNCSDTYFAHNCEGLQEAMFCWNVKGKRYAIGNAQLPPDQYRKIKDMLVEQMADEIIKNKELKYDIFNIGCYKK